MIDSCQCCYVILYALTLLKSFDLLILLLVVKIADTSILYCFKALNINYPLKSSQKYNDESAKMLHNC